jgi:hypothetical protein
MQVRSQDQKLAGLFLVSEINILLTRTFHQHKKAINNGYSKDGYLLLWCVEIQDCN